jgi:pilus assembly protein CpaB
MKVTIVILIILGLVAAMSAVLLVNILPGVIAGQESRTNEITVLVAARDIPAYTDLTNEDLTEEIIDLAQEPDEYANPNLYLTKAINVVGKTIKEPISAGQAIMKNKIITDPVQAAIFKDVQPGMRAFPVRLSSDQIVGGLLEPGCYVDVLVTSATRASARNVRGEAVSKTFLERVKVIAVNAEVVKSGMDEEGRAPQAPPRNAGWTVTLLVNTTQAEALQLAISRGDISLSLRNPLDEEPVDSKGTVWDSSKIGILGEFFDESIQEETTKETTDEQTDTTVKKEPKRSTLSIQVIEGSKVYEEQVAVPE